MYRLAKIGFSQSYTYFTWRNTKAELIDYFTELATAPPRDFFRPNLFVNTPDINPVFLQTSGRAGHLIRAALAGTLSGLWGVYNGFELCEATPMPGKEEYLDSEKYQLKAWDHHRPGNIVAEISALNRIRKSNAALQSHLGVEFLPCDNDQVLYFRKASADGNNLLIAISLDPRNIQDTTIELPLWRFNLPDDGQLAAHDLMRDFAFTWTGKYQPVRLNPADQPFCIWRVSP
jgi:starch synthase (maltosyl-transferring)